MKTATLNYATRNNLEVGTEEYGIANLQMVLRFAKETFVNTLLAIAEAEAKGEVNTCHVTIRQLARVTFGQLKKQDKEVANLWNESWGHIACTEMFISDILSTFENIIFADCELAEETDNIADIALFVDMDALNTAVKFQNMTA